MNWRKRKKKNVLLVCWCLVVRERIEEKEKKNNVLLFV
jgi:hypothetical protein